MKRTYYRLGFCLLMLSFFASCVQKETSSNNTQNSTPLSTGGTSGGSTSGSTDGTTSGSTTGTTTGGSTTGTTTGGYTPPGNVYSFNVMMSGKIEINPNQFIYPIWYPGYKPLDLNQSIHNGEFWDLLPETVMVFQSDARYKVRVRALPEPAVGGSSTAPQFCYRRNSGGGDSQIESRRYTSLQMNISLRDVYSNYTVSAAYATRSITAGLNTYSAVQDFGTSRRSGGSIIGHVVEVSNVRSNAWCNQIGGTYCPFADHPSNRCWNLQLELATDATSDF